MKIHEYQAKEILAKYGVAVPRGEVANTPEEASAVARKLFAEHPDVAGIYIGSENAAGIFGGGQEQKKDNKALINQLYQQIGQLKVEKDFLESRFGR